MRRILSLVTLALAFILGVVGPTLAEPQQSAARPRWVSVEIGIIGASSEDILNSAFEECARIQCNGLVLVLDTPGGALDNTRTMVKKIMSSPVPVAVWVGPAGSRAGSAGAFITLSGHIAAMAPGTNIGAAHPVDASGADVGSGELKRKVTNDTVAFIESVAQARNRNVDMARSFVATSLSITDGEALENNVVDLVVSNTDELLSKMDGREVTMDNGIKHRISSLNAAVVNYEYTFRQKLLSILSNPNFFYLLFMAGLIGLGYELTHPGMIFPGVVGGICIILALIATSVLPVSWGAAALIIVGVIMMIAEAFVTSFGILGIGGFIAFILGSVFLVDPRGEAGLRISLLTIAPSAIAIAAAFLCLGWLIVRSERAPVRSGAESLIGSVGQAIEGFTNGRGQIKVQGAIWAAVVDTGPSDAVAKGDKLRVVAMDGLKLKVSRV